jgi:hypothetical protein
MAIISTYSGRIFTADWKTELLQAGFCYQVSVGGIAAGGAETVITGGGSGTTIDTDQPELAVGVPAGKFLIPLEFHFSGRYIPAADDEVESVILFTDRTQNIPAPDSGTSTVETPSPLLDGGDAFSGYAQSAVTADITDPVLSDWLVFKTVQAELHTAVGVDALRLEADWEPQIPHLLKGPCSVIGAWGGTAAVSGACSFVFAEVDSERFE